MSRQSHAVGRQKWLGHMAMMLFAALIAGSFTFGALTAPHIGAAPITAIRFVLGAGVMALVVAATVRGGLRWPAQPWRFFVLGGLMSVYFVTMFYALGIASPVSIGAVFTLNPFFSAIFGFLLLRQVPRPVVLVSLLVAASGAVWVIFRGDPAALMRFEIGRGELVYLFGVICHAAYAPLVRLFSRGEPVAVSTLWSVAATAVIVSLYGWSGIAETDWTGLPAIVWLAVAYLAIVTTAFTLFLLQFASLRLPAAKVFAYGYLTPAFIIVLEGLVGHGWAAPVVMAGALFTVLGLVVLALSPDT
ncbi:DMT family transporter [Zhengella sp. ZM62]|uniref:DMT family transporter n=1 Tax=Zhengella sedimenti TaxID=3390035 RepID=UPI003974F211